MLTEFNCVFQNETLKVKEQRMNKKTFSLLVLVATLFSQVGESKNVIISPTENDHETIQEALILLQDPIRQDSQYLQLHHRSSSKNLI